MNYFNSSIMTGILNSNSRFNIILMTLIIYLIIDRNYTINILYNTNAPMINLFKYIY